MELAIDIPETGRERGLPDKLRIFQKKGEDAVFITLRGRDGMYIKVSDLLEAVSKLDKQTEKK